MTSIPASRSARAMIFAPRSCPSRPGFAMTTLIFRATSPSLRPDARKRQRPDGALLERPLPGRPVVLPPRGGGGQRHVRDAPVAERRHRDAERAGNRAERRRADLSGLLRTGGGPRTHVAERTQRDRARSHAEGTDASSPERLFRLDAVLDRLGPPAAANVGDGVRSGD